MDIGFDREAGCRENPASRNDIASFKPQAVGKRQPAPNATVALAFPVMVNDALAPDSAQLRIAHSREDRSVLDGDHALVAIAIERPCLYLAAAELSRVQQLVEGMQVVITLAADCTQAFFELSGTQQPRHSSISIPS